MTDDETIFDYILDGRKIPYFKKYHNLDKFQLQNRMSIYVDENDLERIML